MHSWVPVLAAALAGALVAPAGPAAAASDCAKDTQGEINACLSQQAGAADARLDAAFARAVERTAGTQAKAELVASQRQWLHARQAACDAEAADYEGGSMQPAVRSACMAEKTGARIGVLKAVGR